MLNECPKDTGNGASGFVGEAVVFRLGESMFLGKPFKADDLPMPADPYGVSKYEAEEALKQLSLDTGMEVVIIRPPLVYGPGMKANFLSMMRWLERGVPLPLGAINNRRSLVLIENLVDLINVCISRPEAAGNTFLVSDGEDLSTSQLLRRIANALGVGPRLLAMPSWVRNLGASIIGRRDLARRPCGSLKVDFSKAREILGWQPVVSVDETIRHVAEKQREKSQLNCSIKGRLVML